MGRFEPRSYLFEFDLPALGDCNANGVADTCDINMGTSGDFNQDGIPDECQSGTVVASLDAGGFVLHPSAPNPFNPVSEISFELSITPYGSAVRKMTLLR